MKAILNPYYGLYHDNRQVFCDSLQVGEVFGRNHAHILRAIETLNQSTSGLSDEFRTANFIKTQVKLAKRLQKGYKGYKTNFIKLKFLH